MRLWLIGILVVTVSLLAVNQTRAQNISPNFVEEECYTRYFAVPDNVTMTCGTVDVPEDYADPNSEILSLYVVKFHTNGTRPAADPVVYLHGGPGNSSIFTVWGAWSSFSEYALDRDLIVFDLRGTGFSEPSLSCPELYDIAEYTLTEWTARMDDCHTRLEREGRNFATYTSATFARDMDQIRQAMGYEQWNLLGISYGTRLALTALRDNPAPIRSVILDSTFPLEIDLYEYRGYSAERAFTTLFESCRQDIACNTAYPTLEADFYALVERMNGIQPPDRYFSPDADRVAQGDGLVRSLFQALYRTDVIPSLPRILHELSIGDSPDYAYFNLDLQSSLSYSALDSAIRYALECNEELPFNNQSLVTTSSNFDALIRFATGTSEDMFALCQSWTLAPPDPRESMPVTSDVPVLIMAGEFDPITPPQWGIKTHQHLSNSTFVMIPHAGHGVSILPGCPRQIGRAFLNSPNRYVDTSCAQEVIPFAIPNAEQFESFTDDYNEFDSVRPIGWRANQDLPGNLSRTSYGYTNLAQLTYFNYNIVDSKDYIEGIYNIYFPALETFELQTDWLDWTVYLADELGMYVALAENGDNTQVVILYAPITEFRVIRDSLLIPVLESYHPFNLD